MLQESDNMNRHETRTWTIGWNEKQDKTLWDKKREEGHNQAGDTEGKVK